MITSVRLLLLLFVQCVVLCGVTAQSSEAKFSVGGNTVARAGDVTYLFCNREDRTADPPSSYVWVKDGKVTPGHTKQVLTLSSVTRQDAGYYQCGTPDSSSYGQGVHLHVFVPGDVLPKPNLQVLGWQIAGRSVSLYCNFFHDYIPSPATSYTWYKDSVEIKGQKSDSLSFPNLTETDQGDYTCTAREGPPETTSLPSYEVDLRVLVPAQVRIKPPGPMVRGVRGENLTLTCEVTRAFPGVPDDGYSWSYLPYPKGPQRPLEGKTNTLTLGPLTLEDRGQYVCQARNDQMYRHLDFTLGGNASVTVDVVYLDNLTLTTDLEVSEDDRVTLTCVVESRPTAQLTWIVHGQEVRHVTDNVDHYVISKAACSDSGSYTCGASNTELPGRDRHATLQLYVHCNHILISEAIEMKVGAIFNFPLPDWTPMVVVHPGGHDVISVRQDCSYNVSPAFQSRCLQPWCDSKRHRLSFTLTNVTEEDEGDYVCLEEGPQRRPVFNCSKILHVNKLMTEKSQNDSPGEFVIALATCISVLVLLVGVVIGILLGTRRNRSFPTFFHWMRNKGEKSLPDENIPLIETRKDLQSVEGNGKKEEKKKSHTFERLYTNGKVYTFPSLVSAMDDATSSTERGIDDKSASLLSAQDQKPSAEQKVFKVKDLLRSTLQNSFMKRVQDLPSFVLHNYRGLGKQENTVLVLDKKIGIVVMVVNTAMSLEDLPSAGKATRHLVEARNTVRRKLRGLVTFGAVRAVLSLPCLAQNEAEELRGSLEILQSHPDIELLAGQDPQVFEKWVEHQQTGSERVVWESRSQKGHSSDSIYKMVVSSFLTLPFIGQPGESLDSSDPAKSLLLTPAQVEVRDSTARLLHVRGPPGSGKTMLLVHRARQWLAEGKAVILAVEGQFCDTQLAEIERAVRKRQRKETCSRIRVCCTVHEVQTAAKDLKDTYADVEVCLLVDLLGEVSLLKLLLQDIRSGSLSYIWTAGWGSISSAPTDLSKQIHDLGWESLHLPDCIRCTDNTVELLNLLGKEAFPPIPSCSVPRDQDIPPWRVVDHCLHLDHVNAASRCVPCRLEMAVAFPSMKHGLHWSDWIALQTGNMDVDDDCKPIHEALKFFCRPVFYDHNAYLHNDSLRPGATASDSGHYSEHVKDDTDKEDCSTMQLLRVKNFKGMEREGVIIVHWDERDIHPECQSQGERASRLEEHRRQWIQAASSSTGQVILLLLSPSPARSLLGLPEAVMP